MQSKRAQLTIFAILGVTLVIIFGFLYYVADVLQPEPITLENTQKLIKTSLLESYVTQCLQRTSIDAITKISNQGGKIIFTSQDPTIEILDSKKMLYTISKAQLPSYVTIPYPFVLHPTLPYPYFGKDNLPALCQTDGPNEINPEYQSCFSYSKHNSIQEQLGQYLETNIEQCTQLDTLFQGTKHGTPKSEVVIGEKDIQFYLDYPITYTMENQEFKLEKFNYKVNIRMKDIHEFIKDLIRHEISDPGFVINSTNAYKEIPKYQEGFLVEKVDIGKNSIVTIKDLKSMLEGYTYTFKFAIQNRQPIIKNIRTEPSYLIETQDTETVIFKQPVSVTLYPIISDPDDDQLITSVQEYSGIQFTFIEDDKSFVWQNSYSQEKTLQITVHTSDNSNTPITPQKSLTIEIKPFSVQ